MLSTIKLLYYSLKKLYFTTRYSRLTLGKNFKCGSQCSFSKKNIIVIKDDFYMGRNCHLACNLEIGNDVMFGSYVSCVGGDHNIDNINVKMNSSGRDHLKTTIIKDNVWIGTNAIILQNVTAQLRKSTIQWQLTEEEIIEKRFDWIKKTIKNYDAIVEHYKSKE